MKLHFWGATEGVTGSMTVIELPEGNVLIDCGLVQGEKHALEKNWETLPFVPADISALILTHAHLDHSGYIPKLVKDGFRGDIYCTQATRELALVIMEDSAKIQESDEGKKPLYVAEDVNRVLSLFKVKEIGKTFPLAGAHVKFQSAGHILGAISAVIDCGMRIVFSGDLGRSDDALILSPELCPPANFVVMESTYGGRVRQGILKDELEKLLVTAYKKQKTIIVASFAVARAQLLLTLIYEFYQEHPEYKLEVFIDSPMMKKANRVYKKYAEQTKHPEDLYEAIEQANVIEHQKEWDSIKKRTDPFIVLASSGMVTGGRIWRYLANWQDEDNVILFLPGYQAEGTTGRFLSEGGREISDGEGRRIRWSGDVVHSDAFSSHADQKELSDWVSSNSKDAHVYLVHGDFESKQSLRDNLMSKGVRIVSIPKHGEVLELIEQSQK